MRLEETTACLGYIVRIRDPVKVDLLTNLPIASIIGRPAVAPCQNFPFTTTGLLNSVTSTAPVHNGRTFAVSRSGGHYQFIASLYKNVASTAPERQLRKKDFSSITPAEATNTPQAELLRKAFDIAPQLFTTYKPRRIRKQKAPNSRVAQLYSDAQRPDPSRLLQVLPKADELERLYPSERDIYIHIFLAIKQSDQAIELRELSKRFHYYALTQLHPKGTSIEPIIKRIKDAISDYDGTGRNISIGVPSLLGILCTDRWERASEKSLRAALSNLALRTDLYEQASKYTKFTRTTIARILSKRKHSFAPLESPLTFISEPPLPRAKPLQLSRQASPIARLEQITKESRR
ncbi:hypothetical protein CCUS01_03728 [Colletotrichum cuscutae]|uniref:Uncharacterized protein n=1 Tax=Colletotrichum cuscutae TaxID=1209917 RepID=A0AAI9VHC9_9PEZI|nr:hypothetical protein CCUS01_03728 [Colletotrichum cuscutae]